MTYNVMVDDMDTVIDTTNMTYNVMVDDMDTVIDVVSLVCVTYRQDGFVTTLCHL